MENNAPEVVPETGDESAPESAPKNVTENAPESQAENVGQMTLENLTSEVSEIYAGFDPAKHAVNGDGTPKKRADGQWANKRGRKPGQTVGPVATATPAPTTSAPLSAKKARESGLVTNKAAAYATVKTVIYTLGSTIGPEWDFATPEEQKDMLDAVEAYYDANGQVQMSPELMLAARVLVYAAPRTQHPNTKQKMQNAWAWCKNLLKIGGPK